MGFTVGRLNPIGEYPIRPAGLWLKRVDVICGNAIVNVHPADPREVVMHGPGGKASSLPLLEKLAYRCALLCEGLRVSEELPIVAQVMHHDFEAATSQRLTQYLRSVVAKRHKAKSGPET